MIGGKNEAENTVYVGDGAWDARAARKLGIGFVGVRHDGRRARLHAELVTLQIAPVKKS